MTLQALSFAFVFDFGKQAFLTAYTSFFCDTKEILQLESIT